MKRIVIVAALLVAAGLAEAQHLPPGKWWRRPEVVRELTLTADQQDRLDDVFRVAANDLIDAKAAVDKLQLALRGEIDRTQLRRGEIERLGNALHEARGKLFSRELMMLVEMRSVLNDAQWNRFRQHLDKVQERGDQRQGQGRPGMGGRGQRPNVGPGRRP
jgi:hypothetical protein